MTLPVIDPASFDARGPVAGVLLAAGTSSRFGEANKLLAPVDDEPLVRRAARSLTQSEVTKVIVVIGYEGAAVREALDGLPVVFVENPEFTEGQATSVRVGTEAAGDSVDAIVFALGDMPWVRARSVNAVVGAYYDGAGRIVAAAYEGRRGNPVLFDAGLTDKLTGITGDTGARELLMTCEETVLVETGDPGVIADIDTSSDLTAGRPEG